MNYAKIIVYIVELKYYIVCFFLYISSASDVTY